MNVRSNRAAQALLEQAWQNYRAGQLREAEAQLQHVIAAAPGRHEALYLLGLIAYRDRRHEQAIAHFGLAIRGNRKSPLYHTALGAALADAGKPGEAVASFQRSVSFRPADSRAHSDLGEALRRSAKGSEAETSLRRAIALDGSNRAAHYSLGTLLCEIGREAEAIVHLTRAADLDPDSADSHTVWGMLGVTLDFLGRRKESLECLRRAVERAPQDSVCHLQLAYTLLAAGELEEGWREYEWRFGPGTGIPGRTFPHPYWRGEALDDKSLLVWMEQGIGDELTFASLLADVAARAAKCLVECSPKLATLFRRSFPTVDFVPRSDPPDSRLAVQPALQVAAGSLARWLRSSVGHFSGAPAYLRADPARVAYWRERLDALGPGLKVGFCWRSHVLSGTRALACARIEDWIPILRIAGVRFMCLQYDDCAAELARVARSLPAEVYRPHGVDLFNDLDEAAAVTRAADLVITAPTAVSQLATGLGVETWQISYGPDWKTLGTDRTPWYPTLTRFDRASGQPWEQIIQAVATKLAERARSSA